MVGAKPIHEIEAEANGHIAPMSSSISAWRGESVTPDWLPRSITISKSERFTSTGQISPPWSWASWMIWERRVEVHGLTIEQRRSEHIGIVALELGEPHDVLDRPPRRGCHGE